MESIIASLQPNLTTTILAFGYIGAALVLLVNFYRFDFLKNNILGIATIILLFTASGVFFAYVLLGNGTTSQWEIWLRGILELLALLSITAFILISFESRFIIGVYRALVSAKRQLRQQENWMRLMQEYMKDGLAVYSPKGELLYINPAAEQMLDIDPKMIGTKQNLIFGYDYHNEDEVVKMEKKVLNKETVDTKINLKDKKGRPRTVNVGLSPVYDKFSRVIGIAASYRDVSSEEKLEVAKKEFIQIASHELRTPLTAVKGFIALLSMNKYGQLSEKQKALLQRAKIATDRLSTLVDNLLLVAKIEENRAILNRVFFSIEDIIIPVVNELGGEADRCDITLEVNMPKDRKTQLYGDKVKIIHVLTNLVGNAIKYTGKGGKVTINVKISGENVQISVSDTGVGVAKKDLQKLFKKFERIHNKHSIHVGGSGLGLVIVKSFTEMHGGSVSVSSKAGKGSTFTITMPLLAYQKSQLHQGEQGMLFTRNKKLI